MRYMYSLLTSEVVHAFGSYTDCVISILSEFFLYVDSKADCFTFTKFNRVLILLSNLAP